MGRLHGRQVEIACIEREPSLAISLKIRGISPGPTMDFLNREVSSFLGVVTDRGQKLQ